MAAMAALVYASLTLAFLALLFISNKYSPHFPQQGGGGRSFHRRTLPGGHRLTIRKLNPNLNLNHNQNQNQNQNQSSFVAFDPIIAEMERRREDRAWEREYFRNQYDHWGKHGEAHLEKVENHPESTHHHESSHHYAIPPESDDLSEHSWDYEDPEDYLNDEEKFNVTQRIVTLFPLLDCRPHDGVVSIDELQQWHYLAGLKEAQHRADRELEAADKNHDGMLSVAEYTNYFYPDGTVGNDTLAEKHEATWMELFVAADLNNDTLLNNTEFNDFLHPQESTNPKLLQLLLKRDISDHDHDHDGRLSFTEFQLGLHDMLKSYEEDEPNHHDQAHSEAHDKQVFDELDKNKDGFIMEEELQPAFTKLHPGEHIHAKQQAEYLMQQADINKDGHLTLEEMIENPFVFYSTAYAHDDYDDYTHEEFK